MKCKQELEVLSGMLNDFINTLPPSARAAVSSQAGICMKNIGEALAPQPVADEMPPLPVTDAVVPDVVDVPKPKPSKAK